MKLRSSIREIAARMGLSHTTVSLSLRNNPRITPATRKRVQLMARSLGYHRDPLLATLMTRLRTLRNNPIQATLGFVTAWPTRAGWRELANYRRFYKGAEHRALQLGYRIEEFWLAEPGMTEILRARGIHGLILLSLPSMGGRLELGWENFACVTKGLTVSSPRVHRVVSSHYEDMQLVLRQLDRRRYHRVGLVLSEALNVQVDRAWLAAFLVHQNDIPAADQVPALIVRAGKEEISFHHWFTEHRPDAVLFSEQPVPQWIEKKNLLVPRDVGLVHLNWSREEAPLAGLDSDPETLGVAATDLLAGQLQANEFGIPKHEKIVAVRGLWVAGTSLRRR